MAKNETTTVVATVENKNTLPAGLEDMYQDAGSGLENTSTQDYAIPFLGILQALSPQLNRQEGAYIKGAEQGNIFNNVTNEVIDGEEKGILVIPVAFQFKNIEWKPRESGGGLVAMYDRDNTPTDVSTDDRGRTVRPNGNIVSATAHHYVLVISEDGNVGQAVIAMTSTQLKKSRRWNSMMSQIKLRGPNGMFTPPTYSHVYRLKTVPESNNQGSWYGWNVTNEGLVTDKELYTMAKEFSKAVTSGQVEAKPVDPDASSGAESTDAF
jgi:hypothetical protein